jgi:hypothetical protein
VIRLLAAVVALQGGGWTVRPPAPTVGDTVWIERVVPAPVGAVGRPRLLPGDDLVEPLRAPEVTAAAGGLVVRYTVAFFAPGRHAISMPALEVVHPDGEVELVLGDTALADVRAVLTDTAGPPRDARAPLGRLPRRAWPVATLTGGVLALLAAWAWRRWRRGPAPPLPPAEESPTEVPLMRWLAAGERRAVATLAMLRVRTRLESVVPEASRGLVLAECLVVTAAARPDWSMRELTDVLTALERARFAPLAADDLTELVDRADVLLERLSAAPAPAPA